MKIVNYIGLKETALINIIISKKSKEFSINNVIKLIDRIIDARGRVVWINNTEDVKYILWR